MFSNNSNCVVQRSLEFKIIPKAKYNYKRLRLYQLLCVHNLREAKVSETIALKHCISNNSEAMLGVGYVSQ